MTIAVSVKVHDGLVFASDSAGTFQVNGEPTNVYNNLNKIFNLHKKLPIAGMMFGDANIGSSSISTLSKDLRARFTHGFSDNGWKISKDDGVWKIGGDIGTVQKIADLTGKFFDECLSKITPRPPLNMGFYVGGYSSGKELAEVWKLEWKNGVRIDPILRRDCGDTGSDVEGMPEPVNRLIYGYGSKMPDILLRLGLPEDQLAPVLEAIKNEMSPQFEQAAMPIQDAIDLAEFYAKTAISYWRFHPGAAKSVGGPIEVAAITKYEGFTWIKRKHYFSLDLNVQKELA